jgi:hypothetical protein
LDFISPEIDMSNVFFYERDFFKFLMGFVKEHLGKWGVYKEGGGMKVWVI